ncbi:Zn-dependent oligopeptidase [Burkholderiales bacterium JOSHI_001]|nr:Zn-dependent oligopeptidase [Burkholderiales bacterium JOSHI_001]
MKKLLSAYALSTWLALPVLAQPALSGPAFPRFENPAALTTACDSGLAQAKVSLATLLQQKVDKHWLRAYDNFSAGLEDLSNPLLFLANVHPDKALREASEACELRWQDFLSSLGQNPALYRALKAVPAADAIDRELRQAALDGLVDSGVGLPPAQRKRVKQLSDGLAALEQSFQRNIRDANTRVAFSEAEVAGVPEAVWKDAKRNDQGQVLLGLDMPIYLPVMQGAESAAARERMWRAKSNEGGEPNLKLLAQIRQQRQQLAALFRQPSYAHFKLRRQMAANPQRAMAFLDEVKAAVTVGEKGDLEEMRQAKARHLKQDPAGVKLQRWDVAFYEERVRRERYAVDQEAFRPYFPPQQSLEFVMRVVEKAMGVRYTRVPDVALWHPEALAYAVADAGTGRSLGTLYVDLYPREGKYNHAAVWPLRGASVVTGRTPIAALVVNFDRQGLSLEELETLLHEFGHAVHNNLSAVRYASQAGTSVKHDFVEAPSQMLEDWVYDPKVLQVFQEVCPACKPVPEAMLAQAVKARDFAKGVLYARQHLYASYDLALFGTRAQDPLALWQQMEGATALGHVAGTMFPAGFGHIAGGYGAGYYGYLWSLVLAMDMRTAFGDNKLDAQVGRRYRDTVLANGSQFPPDALLRRFLGREANAKAFFDYLRK